MQTPPQTPRPQPSIADRGRTAIRRYRASKPVALAVAHGIIGSETTVFDYGCGHGDDLRFFRARKISASGWDPVHRPDQPLQDADVVNLGYVLNVIESARERADALQRAYQLARQVLVVSVRVDRTLNATDEYEDGVLTGRGTFQKIFTQAEFLAYVEASLQRRPHAASLGIAFVFKDERIEAQYIAQRAFTRRLEYRPDLIADFARNRGARRLIRLANKLGRVPIAEEFSGWAELLELFGSPQRIERLLLRTIDPQAFEGSREARREDILTYLAMLRLRGITPPKVGNLPASIRQDIKVVWGSYAKAVADATTFLFSLGEPVKVEAACRQSRVGKLLPGDLYVHTSAEDELPALLRLLLFAGKQIVGDVAYDVLKLSTHGRSLSFLRYPEFDSDPHPALHSSIRVYLPRADYSIRDYSRSDNPPILHRKDTLVTTSHPLYDQFRELTVQEKNLGLLSQPGIGFRREWLALLESKQLGLTAHALLSRAPS